MPPNLVSPNSSEWVNMGVVETFPNYVVQNITGRKHPSPVIETASLESVAPLQLSYTLRKEIVATGSLSVLQLESTSYASQQHEKTLLDGS